MKNIKITIGVLLAFMATAVAMGLAPRVLAVSSPQRIVYSGRLLDSDGAAITSAHSIRFSFWTSTDYVDSNTTATGSINVGASSYAGWSEVNTVTPNSDGYFSLELGGVSSLPDFSTMPASTLLSMYLQVEVKPSASANTAYELLDRDSSDAAVDRSPMRSVPFALNANLLDQRGLGTHSGAIPYLQSGSVFPQSVIPSGMTGSSFTIDADGSEGSGITLQFGGSLKKELQYDLSDALFDFNDDVRVSGDLTVSGLINGIDITSLVGDSQRHLKVSSGAGLTISIAGGDYRVSGSVTQYAGASNIAVQNSATNYIFFTSTGLTVSLGSFPTGKSYIPLATVQTSGGSISSVVDRRVFNSDDREQTVEIAHHAPFEGGTYQGDGSNNVGQLHISHHTGSLTNFYSWQSTLSSLQDYDVIFRTSLSNQFQRWGEDPLVIRYRTATADTASNQIDFEVYDTSGNQVSLSGSTTNLASTGWTTTQIEFAGSPQWTAGGDILIKAKLQSKNSNAADLGDISIQYKELLGTEE